MFLTGRHEIYQLCRKLNERFSNNERCDSDGDLCDKETEDLMDVDSNDDMFNVENSHPLLVLPLYSTLSNEKQAKVSTGIVCIIIGITNKWAPNEFSVDQLNL